MENNLRKSCNHNLGALMEQFFFFPFFRPNFFFLLNFFDLCEHEAFYIKKLERLMLNVFFFVCLLVLFNLLESKLGYP